MGINTGALYIIIIMLALFGLSYLLSGPTPHETHLLTGAEVVLVGWGKATNPHANLQLYNFGGITITPPMTSLCRKGGDNIHPEALIAYSPEQATAISTISQITLWVSDTLPPYIAPNEQIARSSGAVIKEGDLSAKAPDGYLLEPQLYVFPETVEKNGKAYFPSFVRGDYNNGSPDVSYSFDTLPPNSLPASTNTAEFVWNVQDIGLTLGTYNIEFVAHDGHEKLGIKCMTIRIYTDPKSIGQDNPFL